MLTAVTLGLLAGALLDLHGRVFRLPFVSDDYFFLLDAWRGGPGDLFGADEVHNYFRPLGRELYFFLFGRLFGNDPLGFRVVNFATLLAILGLVTVLGGRLFGPRAGLLAAVAYALFYPHRVVLAWVSCAQDLVATLLALLAVLAYLGRHRLRAAAAFFLALFAKESVAPLPLILAAWELARSGPPGSLGRRGLEALRRTSALWIAAAIWAPIVLVVRASRAAWSRGGDVAAADVTLRPDRLWEGLRSGFLTFFHLEQPWSSLVEAARSFQPPWIAIVLILAAAGIAFAARREAAGDGGPAAGGRRLAGLWAALGLVPVALAGHHFSAYYVAFAAIGFALLAGDALSRLPRVAAAALLLLAAGTNVVANSTTMNRLGSDETAPSGVSYVTASRLAREGRFLDSLRVALEHDPLPRAATLYLSHAPHGTSLATAMGRALQVWFEDPTLRLSAIGEYRPERREAAPRFLRYDLGTGGFVALPRALVDASIAGEAHLARGEWSLARRALTDALRATRPGIHDLERAEIGNSLGVAALRDGDPAAARAAWAAVLEHSPRHRGALLNLAGLEASAADFASAKRRIERLLEVEPGDALGLLFLARLERVLGNGAAADRAWSRLSAVDPAFADSVARLSGRP